MKNMIPIFSGDSWCGPDHYIKEFLVDSGIVIDDGPCHVDHDEKDRTFTVGFRERRHRAPLSKVFATGKYAGDVERDHVKSLAISFTTPGWREKIENGCALEGSHDFVNELSRFTHVKKGDKKAVLRLFETFAIKAATPKNTEFCHEWCLEAVGDDHDMYCIR